MLSLATSCFTTCKANVSVKHDSSSSAFACLQTDILQEFHQYLLEMVLSNSQNCDVAYVRRRFSFLFCPITSLAVIQNMHLETPTLMMKTCLLRQQQQEWPILMASCLFCIIQTLQSNLESIHIGTIEELKTTKKLVEEFLSLEIFNTAIIKAFRTLKDKIENVTCE